MYRLLHIFGNYILCFILFFYQISPLYAALNTSAGNIIIDGTTNTKLDTAQNGVPLINIAAPTSLGVSHNKVLVLISPRCTIRDSKEFSINRNIWCYNEYGEKEWEVENRLISMDCENKKAIDPYTGFWKEGGKWMVHTFGGFVGDLDVETGKVINWHWKR